MGSYVHYTQLQIISELEDKPKEFQIEMQRGRKKCNKYKSYIACKV